MKSTKSSTHPVFNCVLTVLVLLNTLVPTPVTANTTDASIPVGGNGLEESRHLPVQPKIYYEPETTLPEELNFSPAQDEVEPVLPDKDLVYFSIFTTNGEIEDSTLTVNVKIRNNTVYAVTDLGYFDKLQDIGTFISSSDQRVEFNSTTNTVLLRVDELAKDEEISFTYRVRALKSLSGKLAIHNANIEYTYRGKSLSQVASTGFTENSPLVEEDSQILVPDQNGDGWNSSGRFSIYMGEEVISENVIVSIAPADIPGEGPEFQFDLELLQISSPTTTTNGDLTEQTAKLIKPIETIFEEPAYIEIDLDGVIDLKNIPADQEPYIATYDEDSNVWIKVPILEESLETNSVVVEAAHFSTWGAGLGNALPKNGANVLLFDQPYTSLFTGAARYSLPIWTPSGRGGMNPSISLAYSSGTVDGVLGDVQAPSTGVGWSIDGIEIVRKITTNENGYGYINDFALTLNGAAYKLIQDNLHPTRYYTDHDAFLYIERHNYANGNAQNIYEESPLNVTGEWWEVVTTDGTRYRLGWNKDAEQLALMYGYKCTSGGPTCQTPDGAYASLGYAGRANDLIALRWRIDRIQDTHGNYIDYAYLENPPQSGGVLAAFDRESYLKTISYTGYENSQYPEVSKLPNYHVNFIYANRSGDVPTNYFLWDNFDTQMLNRIEVCYQNDECSGGNGLVRSYDFEYLIASAPNANGTLTLSSMEVKGYNGSTTTQAPTIRFAYENKPNRATNAGSDPYSYPRLTTIDNGAGGLLTYTYENDGRDFNTWYNYRVKQVKVESGIGTAALQSYDYGTPAYTGSGGNPNYGELIGYPLVTEKQLDYLNNNAILLSTSHTFGTTGLDTGRELKTEWINAGTTYRKSTNVYVTDNSKAPFTGWNFRYLYSTLNYELGGGNLSLVSKTVYKRDPANGNLSTQFQYLGSSLYRKTYYEYLVNMDPSVYILDSASRVLITDSSNQILGDTRYHFDGGINTLPVTGDITLVQQLTGNNSETVDRQTYYDVYGNPDSVRAYKNFGSLNSVPSGVYYETQTKYDEPLKTFPVEMTNPLGQKTFTSFIYELGLPYQTTDPNNWTTTTEYDGLGRTLSVWAPGLIQPGVYYTYPEVNTTTGRLSAPYSVEMQILDMLGTPVQYRSVWGIYDGLGRILQTQVYNADANTNKLLVTDSYFNAQGLVFKQSLPYESSANGGYYAPPSGTQFNQTTFDVFGRPLTQTQPGNIVTTMSYDGLTTTMLDPNGNKTSRTTDGLGRLIRVQEFSSPTTLYATTYYSYDAADRLVRVLDAKGNDSVLQYNWLGQKTGMDDPDMGVWSYEYSSLGTLKKQTDARGKVLNFTYDELGRLLTKTGENTDIEYTYGTTLGEIGFRKSMTDNAGSATWSYDNYGRNVTESRTLGGVTKNMTTRTDWLGRPISVVYPDGEILTYKYDALGRPDTLTSETSGQVDLVDLAYTVLGQIDQMELGNNIIVNNEYDPGNNRLVSRSSSQVMDYSYLYDNAGNIKQIKDGVLNETHNYSYDFLNRLTFAEAYTTTNQADYKYRQQFEYDPLGNMLKMNDWAVTPQAFLSPEYSEDHTISFNPKGSVGSYQIMPAFQTGGTPTPTPASVSIFVDSFESGDFSAWDWVDADGGDFSVTTQAAGSGSYGAQAIIDDNYELALYDETPNNEAQYTARFYFDPNTTQISSNGGINLFSASTSTGWAACLYLEQEGDYYSLTLCGANDAGTWQEKDVVLISDAWQSVEIEWKAATTTGANDGYIRLYIGDQLATSIENLDNDTHRITDVSLAVADSFVASGTMYFDAFESRAGGHIGLDSNGPLVSPAPSRPDLMFSDNFEVGNLSEWNPALTSVDGGDLSATAPAAYQSAYGLNALIDDTVVLKAVDSSPADDTRYRARFYFHPNSLTMGNNTSHFIFDGMNTADNIQTFRLELFYESGTYKLRPRILKDDWGYTNGSKYALSNAWHVIEIDWSTATAPGANNGYLSLWIDGSLVGTIANVDNDSSIQRLNEVRLGATNGLDATTSGAMFFDNFESRRASYIGPVSISNTDTPTPEPALTSTPTIPGSTASLTPTNTSSPTPIGFTNTPTITATRTNTPTVTTTHTNTPTPTNTKVPTNTSLPSPTLTATNTPTPLPTITPWSGVDAYTKSMLHLDGADASTSFVDAAGKTWTVNGNAQLDTAQKKFGSGSALFDGTGDYLTTTDNADFAFGSGDFTIDFWVRPNVSTTSGGMTLYDGRPLTTHGAYVTLHLSPTNQIVFVTNGAVRITGDVLTAGNWYHVALTRSGNSTRLFLNGVQTGITFTDTTSYINGAGRPIIGNNAFWLTGYEFNGWMDEFRITKGYARWTSNFTPPVASSGELPTPTVMTPTSTPTVPSATFTATFTPTKTPTPFTLTPTPSRTPTPTMELGSLVGYWNFNGSVSPTVLDVASGDTFENNATLTNGPVIESTGLELNSIFFDGANDYASIAGPNEIPTSGSFTISAWVNPAATVTNKTQYIVKKGGANQDFGLITVTRQGTPTPTANPSNFSNGSIAFEVGGVSPSQLYGPVLPINAWTHITGVYDATAKQMRLYINGDLVAAQAVTGSMVPSVNPLTFSSSNVNNVYSGRLDEVRLYNRALTSDEVSDVYGIVTPSIPSATPTPTFTPLPGNTATPLPMSQQQWGTGNDGPLTVNTGTTFNLNAQTNGNNARTCADAIAYNVTLLSNTTASLNSSVAGCLSPGDEVLLIQLTDSSPNAYNAGQYEFLRVESVSGSTVNFSTPKKYWYGSGWRSDANIGITAGQYRVMLIRVPNYSNVTINGSLTASVFDGNKNGVIAFRVSGTLSGSGTITANGLGFSGHFGYGAGLDGGSSANQPGGGGGYGAQGATVWSAGGSAYGTPNLSKLFFGSGGGHFGGFQLVEDGDWYSGGGGSGGGMIVLAAQNIAYTGAITSNGSNGSLVYNRMGGGGSGGSIRIEGNTISIAAITAQGAGAYAAGAPGRVAVYYSTSFSATTINPSGYTGMLGQASTPTPTLTPINLTPVSSSWGNGSDGTLTIAVGQTFNMSTTKANGVTCPDGGDAVSYSVINLLDSSASLSTSPHQSCLTAGDEVLLVHLSGSGPNVGNYEYLRVGGVIGNNVYFTEPKQLWYGSTTSTDTNIGTGTGQQRVMLLRVPNYSNVINNGTLKVSAFNSYKGGVIAFRVSGTLSGSGTITANGLGFGIQSGYGAGGQGGNANQPGGGGGYGTSGTSATGIGGTTYGISNLSKVYFGSGGGNFAAFQYPPPDGDWISGGGGLGGGMILIGAQNISYSGTITSSGNNGESIYSRQGGAGSGGSVRIEGNTINMGSVLVQGGGAYAQGGFGRIAVYYHTSLTSPLVANTYTYLQQINLSVVATPTPTSITATPGTALPSSNPGTTGLVSWWTMNEASGQRNDSYGANHLVDNNSAGSALGVRGNALRLVAATPVPYLSVPDNASLSTGNIDFTLSAMVYLESVSQTMILVNKGDKANMNARDLTLYFDQPTSKLAFRVGNGTTNSVVLSSSTVTTGQWYFVTAWHNAASDTLNIQINDGGVGTVSYTGGASDTSHPLTVGAFADGTYNLLGMVDEISFYKSVLTASERTWLYNNGVGRTYADVNPPAQSGWKTREFAYNASIPHAVASVTENATPAANYTYDANGNMTCRVENGVTFLHTYNEENRVSSIARLAAGTCAAPGNYTTKWDFAYDGDGTRVATMTTQYDANGVPNGTSWTAYYFGGAYETRSDSTTIKYYSFAGQTIAMNDGSGLQYFLTDHLGSVVAVTNASGTLISQQRYLPFGGERTNLGSISQTDYGYTGQRDLDPGMDGLMDYKARFYSPYLNHFIQPDTIIPDPSNPQAWNRFAYVNNSPMNFTDPSGHFTCSNNPNSDDYCPPTGGGGSNRPSTDPLPRPDNDDDEEEIPQCGYHHCGETFDIVEAYETGWDNFGQAWNIATNPNASWGQWGLSVSYMGVWLGAHSTLAIGLTLLGWQAIALSASADGDPTNEVQSIVRFDPAQVQAKFKHAIDFGVDGNYSLANASRFIDAMKQHVTNNGTQIINGTYRSTIQTINYFNPNTGLNVITDLENNFISGWRLGVSQINYLLNTGNLK